MPSDFQASHTSLANVQVKQLAEWEQLLERFRPSLTSKARNLCAASHFPSGIEPEDLFQETYFRAWKGREQFRGSAEIEFCGWLLAIMRNVAFDLLKRDDLVQNWSTFYGVFSNEATPSSEAMTREREELIHVCLSKIESTEASVVAMRHFEGLKFAEIASKLALSINTVVGIYRRSLLQLKKILQQHNHRNCIPNSNFDSH